MNDNYNLPDYDAYRDLIHNYRHQHKSWEEIELAGKKNEKELDEFLERKAQEELRPRLSVEGWKTIVKQQKEEEETTQIAMQEMGGAMLLDDSEVVNYSLSTNPRSAWSLYKKKLLEEKKYSLDTVKQLEESTIRLLHCLHLETAMENPVKGLVVGNVQSGKTGSMAALMAMAADQGFNMFIILSGTIENLRAQTAARLFNDLNGSLGTLNWTMLEHLSKKSPIGSRAQDCHFEPNDNHRYMTVCLKNLTRLKNLNDWLQLDPKKRSQMKILVIDDEADQASINTAREDKERTRINAAICNLVNGKPSKKPSKKATPALPIPPFQGMNYVAYTATPYANVLNENKPESLYPKNFIATLSVSPEYFGPQQIFGYEENSYEGLDIVRIIDQDDLEAVKGIHKNERFDFMLPHQLLPKSLEDAICWFIDGVACQRYWGHKKPISMLIHTSQKTDHHEQIYEAIKDFFELYKYTPGQLVKRCEEIWKRETKRFSKENFLAQFEGYGLSEKEIRNYPSFEAIRPEVVQLIREDLNFIKLDENEDLQYRNGIHICVDNCKNNGVTEEGIHMRLMYPKSEEQYDKAPAFIVIGGTTLSRGLTLEGLISSYFLRSVGQADTLMQMGRWFGYRKGYELLPRIWLTQKTFEQFGFLSDLDKELRQEIADMESRNAIPRDYGPRVKNTPSYQFIRITSSNKMQGAKLGDFDFSGAFFQTYRFHNNPIPLKHNLVLTEKFINELGDQEEIKEENKRFRGQRKDKERKLWRNVPFSKVKEYLKDYQFGSNMSISERIDLVLEWAEKLTKKKNLKNWNVVYVPHVKRSKRSERSTQETIDIGALLTPSHLITDIDFTDPTMDEMTKKEIENLLYPKKSKEDSSEDKKKRTSTAEISRKARDLAHLDTTPLMIIYEVDKDSKAQGTGREDLNAPENLIGFCILIPGGQKGIDYATKLSIPVVSSVFDDHGDLEGEDDEN